MARLVRHERTGPYKIEPQDFPKDGKAMWICGCGLSSTMPYCDKTHKLCNDEAPGQTYIYEAGQRRPVEPPSNPPTP